MNSSFSFSSYPTMLLAFVTTILIIILIGEFNPTESVAVDVFMKCGDIIQNNEGNEATRYSFVLDENKTSPPDSDFSNCTLQLGPNFVADRVLIAYGVKLFQLTVINAKFNGFVTKAIFNHPDSFIKITDSSLAMKDGDPLVFEYSVFIAPSANSDQTVPSDDFLLPNSSDSLCKYKIGSIIIKNNNFYQPKSTAISTTITLVLQFFRISKQLVIESNKITGYGFGCLIWGGFFEEEETNNNNNNYFESIISIRHNIVTRALRSDLSGVIFDFRAVAVGFKTLIFDNNTVSDDNNIYVGKAVQFRRILFCQGMKSMMSDPVTGLITDPNNFVGTQFNFTGNRITMRSPPQTPSTEKPLGQGPDFQAICFAQLIGFNKNKNFFREINLLNNDVRSVKSGAQLITILSIGYIKKNVDISSNFIFADTAGFMNVFAAGISFAGYGGGDPTTPFTSPLEPIICDDIPGLSYLGGSLIIMNNKVVAECILAAPQLGGGILNLVSLFTVHNAESVVVENNNFTAHSNSFNMVVVAITAKPNVSVAYFNLAGVIAIRRNNFNLSGSAAWLTGAGISTVYDFLPLNKNAAGVTSSSSSSSSSPRRVIFSENFFIMPNEFELLTKVSMIVVNDTRVDIEISRNVVVVEGLTLDYTEADGVRFVEFLVLPGIPATVSQLIVENNEFNLTFNTIQTGSALLTEFYPTPSNRFCFFASEIGVASALRYAGENVPPVFDSLLTSKYGPRPLPLPFAEVPMVPLSVRIGKGNIINVHNGAIQNFNLILLRNWNPDNSGVAEIDRVEVNFFANSQKTARSPKVTALTLRSLINASTGNIPSTVRITNSKFHFVENPSSNLGKFEIKFEILDCRKSPNCIGGNGEGMLLMQNNQFTFNALTSPTNYVLLDHAFMSLGANLIVDGNVWNFDFSGERNCDQVKQTPITTDGECGLIRVNGLMMTPTPTTTSPSSLQSLQTIQFTNNNFNVITTFSSITPIQFCDSFSLVSSDEHLLSAAASTTNSFSIKVASNNIFWKAAASSFATNGAKFALLSSSLTIPNCKTSTNGCWSPLRPTTSNQNSCLSLSNNFVECDTINGYDSFPSSVSMNQQNNIAANFKCSLLSTSPTTSATQDFISSINTASASLIQLISNSVQMILPIDNFRNISTSSVTSSIPFHVGQGWKIQISGDFSGVAAAETRNNNNTCNKIIEKRSIRNSLSFLSSNTLTLGVELTKQIFDVSSTRNNDIISPDPFCFYAHSFDQENNNNNNTTDFNNTNHSSNTTNNTSSQSSASPIIISPQFVKTINALQGLSMTSATISSISVPTLGFGVARQQAMVRVVEGIRRGNCQGLPDPPSPLEVGDSPTQMTIGESQGRFHIGAVVGDIVLAYGLIILCHLAGMIFVSKKKRNGKSTVTKQNEDGSEFQLEVFARAHVTTIAFVMSSLFFSTTLTQSFLLVAAPNSDVPVGMKVMVMILVFAFVFIPSIFYIYVNLFGRKRIERCRNLQKQEQIVDKMKKNNSNANNNNNINSNFVHRVIIPKFNFFFAPEGEWEVVRSTKRHEFVLFQVALPVVEGYRKHVPWFAVVEFTSQFGLAMASLIPQFVSVAASCVAQVVIVCVSLGVFFLLCVYFRPFQERFVRVVIPVSAVFQVAIVAIAAYFEDDPPDWVDTLIAVSLSFQSVISVVGLVMTFTPLLGPVAKFLMRFLRRSGDGSRKNNQRGDSGIRHNLRSLFVDDEDVEVFGESRLLSSNRNKNNNNNRNERNSRNSKNDQRNSSNHRGAAVAVVSPRSSRNDDRQRQSKYHPTKSPTNEERVRRTSRNDNDDNDDNDRYHQSRNYRPSSNQQKSYRDDNNHNNNNSPRRSRHDKVNETKISYNSSNVSTNLNKGAEIRKK